MADFQSISARYRPAAWVSRRAGRLQNLRRVFEGTLYQGLTYPFSQERADSGEYIRIDERRPSVGYALCRTVVEDSVSLLFGEGRFPQMMCVNDAARQQIAALVAATKLDGVMMDAALRGSVGSVAILLRVLESRVFFEVMDTDYLDPEWRATAPDTMERLTEKYQVAGEDLAAMRYAVKPDDMKKMFWFQRIFTETAETYYQPWLVDQKGPNGEAYVPRIDPEKTVEHGLGFVPVVWVKNLLGGPGLDGCCTFEPAINSQIEIEYQLSQASRGLRYSSDPLLMIREPAGAGGGLMPRSAASALVVSEKGDAKLLEINGTATAAVIEFCRLVRELGLESIHGNRSTPDKMGMAQSGRALELLHEPLVWLAGQLRTQYGPALLELIRMVMRASRIAAVEIAGELVEFDEGDAVTLRWGPWFHPTVHDRLEESQALKHGAEAGHISRKSAVAITVETNGLPDAEAELTEIEKDIAEADARAIALGAQTKAAETLPE
jgi:hypothetical protein